MPYLCPSLNGLSVLATVIYSHGLIIKHSYKVLDENVQGQLSTFIFLGEAQWPTADFPDVLQVWVAGSVTLVFLVPK